MKIEAFSRMIQSEALDYKLDNTTVVIDGDNYFNDKYEMSKLPYELGCEGNRFANFLKRQLCNFIKANIKCFFVFKECNDDIKTEIEINEDSCSPTDSFVLPIFAKNICIEVLNELCFHYINYPLDTIKFCLALAHKYGCSVISKNKEFAFSNISYIPYEDMIFDEKRNAFNCLKFSFGYFLNEWQLDETKFVLFIVLLDTHCFPQDYFIDFLRVNNVGSYAELLSWLSLHSREEALDKISNYLNKNDYTIFIEMVEETTTYLIERVEDIPYDLLLYGEQANIKRNDSMWFEKGVLNKFIAKPYSDLYYFDVFIYNPQIHNEIKHEYHLSIDIIIYAFNLITNYKKDKFAIYRSTGELITMIDTTALPFPKPEYKASQTIFKNGWNGIRSLGLFEHFLKGTMRGIELECLEELPADVRLLMITLTYFSTKSLNETLDELYSILISYIMLGIVFENHDNVIITTNEYTSAINATQMYFQSDKTEIKLNVDKKMITSLNEFQFCLEHMNYLNTLCGSPYKPTIYSKTYNGTFVYRILKSLRKKGIVREQFFEDLFQLAPTVFTYLQYLVKFQEYLLLSIDKLNIQEQKLSQQILTVKNLNETTETKVPAHTFTNTLDNTELSSGHNATDTTAGLDKTHCTVNEHKLNTEPSSSHISSGFTQSEQIDVAITTTITGYLTQEQSDKLIDILEELIIKEALIGKEAKGPTFKGKPIYEEGALKLWCLGKHTLKWLNTAVSEAVPKTQEHLVVKNQADIPKRVRCEIFVHNICNETENIIKVLTYQNPWAMIEKWLPCVAIPKENGTVLEVHIPEDLIPKILAREHKLSYLLDSLDVKFLEPNGKIFKSIPVNLESQVLNV